MAIQPMILELIVLSTLFVAFVAGLVTLRVGFAVFRLFEAADLLRLRPDALLYALTLFSTAFSVIDIYLRASWVCAIGWDNSGEFWRNAWLYFHLGIGLFFLAFHIFTFQLLKHPKICELCTDEMDGP